MKGFAYLRRGCRVLISNLPLLFGYERTAETANNSEKSFIMLNFLSFSPSFFEPCFTTSCLKTNIYIHNIVINVMSINYLSFSHSFMNELMQSNNEHSFVFLTVKAEKSYRETSEIK